MGDRSAGDSSPQFESLLARLRAFLARRHEFDLLTAREVDEIAHELNLSTPDLRALAREQGSPELLRKRLEHAGLSEQMLASSYCDVLRDLQRVCGLCREKARCAADLARERRASPARYCPNELTLTALSRGASSARHGAGIDADQVAGGEIVVSMTSPHPKKAST
ncbi:hypothetical protein [Bradyrhizobium elkanii]|jgi:hypothetical protein|uniref:hypothetical protein n=1 Tax=Bradyrhizobium elkanii TaxID=29448 RepID=UPI0020A00CC8|nr:hypothetical protein [Bradyrhizobium elkanii]MCP1966594.1 hypothetical protein [Bradyrhizobium elkanii]MCS3522761.1 hypothetical protein [Bradyrhizobium elkanii]MCS4070414.1 hypothetical protein [Bradyrhizobium elkanii]MCS4077046.1 hypothetical protein [Bradyrhizobium elkanii]MCS4111902.1 hypothetical protein [Bradyrhizobium elkanii]